MGTRGSTFVQLDSTYRVAQYGQWDHYPSGQGLTVLDFLHSIASEPARAAFVAKVQALKTLTGEEVEALWKGFGADDSGLVGMDVADKMEKAYPHLTREVGAKVLGLIANGAAKEVSLDLDFVKDSLFCEWAYVIDFDKGTFEVFEGFNKRPLAQSQRFYCDGYKSEEQKPYNGKGKPYRFYPVRLFKSYPLASLPTKEQFLKDCEPKDE